MLNRLPTTNCPPSASIISNAPMPVLPKPTKPPPAVHSQIISYRDYPAGTPPDKLASLLAHRVLQADKTGAPYTLELPSLTLTPQNGLREKCLNALALM